MAKHCDALSELVVHGAVSETVPEIHFPATVQACRHRRTLPSYQGLWVDRRTTCGGRAWRHNPLNPLNQRPNADSSHRRRRTSTPRWEPKTHLVQNAPRDGGQQTDHGPHLPVEGAQHTPRHPATIDWRRVDVLRTLPRRPGLDDLLHRLQGHVPVGTDIARQNDVGDTADPAPNTQNTPQRTAQIAVIAAVALELAAALRNWTLKRRKATRSYLRDERLDSNPFEK
ncbi:MAG: hypothetical protein MPN21_27710 [Thermoanaerobaculia bacterium]|nr:hypothetical protein [Thermoanaerobaculia bacterium]